MSKNKKWSENCLWPEPIWDGEGMPWEADDLILSSLDDEAEELLEIKEYFDSLVEEGRLNEDYSLNEDYEEWDDDAEDNIDDDLDDEDDPYDFEPYEFIPEKGLDYWDDGFDIVGWEDDFSYHINLLKIPPCDPRTDPVSFIRGIIDYEFVNENLLRQAFTRRAFSVEYGLSGCYEELEFLGDTVLNTVVTREIVRQLMHVCTVRPAAPFESRRTGYNEGILTKIRSKFVSKEYLSARAQELGLDKYILYGTGEEKTESSREDVVEALIGAVAIDSDWDWETLEKVVDRLLCMQLTYPDEYLKTTYYDLLNAWHQRHFGHMPSYEIYGRNPYYCAIRFSAPENEKDIRTCQRIDIDGQTRSAAREKAAELAYRFLVNNGLWIDLKDAALVPDLENSINQLQELYQKKYVESAPQYEFEPWDRDEWNCTCTCGGVEGFGRAVGKTKAKKKAAYMVLIRLLKAAGICRKGWEKEMWKMV